MKLEELLAPCPKCGSKDKIAHRKLLDNHRAHAEMETVKCEDCGYIYIIFIQYFQKFGRNTLLCVEACAHNGNFCHIFIDD